ncbi:class I SAM-dependent methyltransferase [Nocardioides hwasunensis]|uniref:Methyltransferase domain-containing protein n=1 Tax=Nocardioides hwasunensis TaxID=397258 RepID=A0ABR8MHV5_9ACTN|nr:class I SAM-dependent methyltransferase [Nocardioides hwasunensis]MBD3914347.1 methyltransferase domain-containing protein [Nocardioides hwasunensis]
MAWDREFFYDSYPRVEEAFAARLDESLAPRDPSVLLQVVRELDLRPDSRVVDVGCGEGAHAFRLATHFGFRVLGIDPVQRHLDLAREARRELTTEIASRVSFERGSATQVPAHDATLDLVWCRDVMSHVEQPGDAYDEFARVLRPGGYVAAYQMVATDLIETDEARWLFDVMGVVSTSADPAVLDDGIARSGLRVVDTIDLSSEWGEWSQEQDGRAARALLHLARLLREPERYRAEFGDAAYDVMLGDCRWHVYRMMGKLAGRIDVLQKP